MPTTKLTLPFGTFYIEADGKRVPFEVEDVTDYVNQRHNVERALLLKTRFSANFGCQKVSLCSVELSRTVFIDILKNNARYAGMTVANERYLVGYGGTAEGLHWSYVCRPNNIDKANPSAVDLCHSDYQKTPNGNTTMVFAIVYKAHSDAKWLSHYRKKKTRNQYSSEQTLDLELNEMFSWYRHSKNNNDGTW